MPAPILTLETLEPDRPTVEIDGVIYDLAVPDDFGLLESARLAAVMRRATAVEVDAKALPLDVPLEQAQIDRLDQLLSDSVAMILRAPTEVRARLNSSQKAEVLAAFAPATTARATSPRKSTARSARSTSAKRSRSSKPRTAPRTGTRCRSAS